MGNVLSTLNGLESNNDVLEGEEEYDLNLNLLSNKPAKANTHEQKNSYELNDSCDISNCFNFQRLIRIVNNSDSDTDTCIIDDFCHLLSVHDNHNDFEYIYNKFGALCDITKCKLFERNYRNKNSNDLLKTYSAKQQIIDKIHCYYRHAFDIGNRLNLNENKIINDLT
eukprot:485229_1